MANAPQSPSRRSPPRQSKEQLANILVAKCQEFMAQGHTADEAIERLSARQYDFLCDYKEGVYLDKIRPETAAEKAARSDMAKADRKKRDGGYNKKYPEPKKALYTALVEKVTELGAEIIPREKENFRDLDFVLDGTHYRIVLSNPRT